MTLAFLADTFHRLLPLEVAITLNPQIIFCLPRKLLLSSRAVLRCQASVKLFETHFDQLCLFDWLVCHLPGRWM